MIFLDTLNGSHQSTDTTKYAMNSSVRGTVDASPLERSAQASIFIFSDDSRFVLCSSIIDLRPVKAIHDVDLLSPWRYVK